MVVQTICHHYATTPVMTLVLPCLEAQRRETAVGWLQPPHWPDVVEVPAWSVSWKKVYLMQRSSSRIVHFVSESLLCAPTHLRQVRICENLSVSRVINLSSLMSNNRHTTDDSAGRFLYRLDRKTNKNVRDMSLLFTDCLFVCDNLLFRLFTELIG